MEAFDIEATPVQSHFCQRRTHTHFDVASFIDHQNTVSPSVCLRSAFFILSFKEGGLRKGEVGMKSEEQREGEGGSQTHNGHEGSSNKDIADMKGEE